MGVRRASCSRAPAGMAVDIGDRTLILFGWELNILTTALSCGAEARFHSTTQGKKRLYGIHAFIFYIYMTKRQTKGLQFISLSDQNFTFIHQSMCVCVCVCLTVCL